MPIKGLVYYHNGVNGALVLKDRRKEKQSQLPLPSSVFCSIVLHWKVSEFVNQPSAAFSKLHDMFSANMLKPLCTVDDAAPCNILALSFILFLQIYIAETLV